VSFVLSVALVALNGFRGSWYIYVFRFLILFSSIIPIRWASLTAPLCTPRAAPSQTCSHRVLHPVALRHAVHLRTHQPPTPYHAPTTTHHPPPLHSATHPRPIRPQPCSFVHTFARSAQELEGTRRWSQLWFRQGCSCSTYSSQKI
jgi:hypothetical protein